MNSFSHAFSDPMVVRLVEGEIVVLGPDGVAVSLTVEAARESSRRLAEAVAAATKGENG